MSDTLGPASLSSVVLPYDGEAIEVSEIVQWHGGDVGTSQSKSRLSDEKALLQLAGGCRVSGEGGRFDASFRAETQSGRGVESDVSINLEIDDEENRGFLHCDIRGGRGFGGGRLRGHFSGAFQTEGRDPGSAAEFRLDLFGHHGEGEVFGRLRGSAGGEIGSADFQFFSIIWDTGKDEGKDRSMVNQQAFRFSGSFNRH